MADKQINPYEAGRSPASQTEDARSVRVPGLWQGAKRGALVGLIAGVAIIAGALWFDRSLLAVGPRGEVTFPNLAAVALGIPVGLTIYSTMGAIFGGVIGAVIGWWQRRSLKIKNTKQRHSSTLGE